MEEDDGLVFDDGLKVKYLIKKKKREKLLQLFAEKKKEKVDTNVNSKTLERISSIFNKDSNIYVSSQMEEIKRQKERQRMLQEALNKISSEIDAE